MQKQFKFVQRPVGLPTSENFEFVEAPIPKPTEGEVLVRTVYLSVDPYLRGRMNDGKSYAAPLELGAVMSSRAIGQVVESKSGIFHKGDIVVGRLEWQEYSVVKEAGIRKVNTNIAPVTAYLSVLGMTGLTAYFGLLDIGKPQKGETVVVSGAGGAVGSVVGQIAKIKSARVVGIAGSVEKLKYLTDKLGFDAAINYKTEDVKSALKKACPNGIDVYFENVGGEIADAVFPLLNKFARIPVCGAISAYNDKEGDSGPRIQQYLIRTSALMRGYAIRDYASRFAEGEKALAQWLQEGKLQYEVTVTEGFDQTINAFLGLFAGANLGKAIVKVSEIEVK